MIVQHLMDHPDEVGQCYISLMRGLMKPEAQEGKAGVKWWLPDSNSRMSHVAGYFLEAWLVKIDPRYGNEKVAAALKNHTQKCYDEMETPKDERHSWQHQHWCLLCCTDPSDPVPTRYKPKLVQLYCDRCKEQGYDLKKLPLELVGGKLQYDQNVHGVYKYDEPDEQGRILQIIFVYDGTAVLNLV